MKVKTLLLAPIFLLIPFLLFSQKFTLRGAVVDTTGAPLEIATVMLLNPADSSLLSFTRTGAGGAFSFKNLSAGDYIVRAAYLGFRNLQRPVHLPTPAGTSEVDLGNLKMETNYNVLGEVEIKAAANPVTFRKDTIEYNAGSFKVKDNAVVEDLLKKLPGVEVERDGTVKAQGEEVKNVLVDGKKFFGNDPKIATQNLPADAVDKVQVYDKKSEQATFSGIDDGQKEKTINLDLKEDKKKGWFGRATAAGGSDVPDDASVDADARYEGRLSLNRFRPKQQLSFLGLGNNVNKAGFSIDDYMAFSGAARQMMGGGGRVTLSFDVDNQAVPLADFNGTEGFQTTWAGGVNFDQEYGRKNDINGSYFYTNTDRRFHRESTREDFIPGRSSTTTGSTSDNDNLTKNHRLNFTLEQRIDSFNSIQFTGGLVHTDNDQSSSSFTRNSITNGLLLSDGQRRYQSDASADKWTGGLLFRHKFPKKGRTVSTDFNFGFNANEVGSLSFSENRFYDDGGAAFRVDTLDQDQAFQNDASNISGKATYTEPLGGRRYLELNYGYFYTENRADKQVYDLDAGERSFNALLSNAYQNTFGYHRGGLGVRINRKAWNASLGMDVQSALLTGAVTSGAGQPIRKTYNHALPRADFSYEFSPSSNLRLNYVSGISAPTVQQLQPVPDVSDPLNIFEGNPDLRPSYSHTVQVNYGKFNPESQRSFFTGLFVTYTQDRIVNAQFLDSFLVRHYRPVNVDNDYRLDWQGHYGFRIKDLDSRVRLRAEARLDRGQNFINGLENTTTNTQFGPALSWDYEPKEWLTLSAGAEYSWRQAAYSLSSDFNRDYAVQTYTGDLHLDLPWSLSLESDLEVTVNDGLAEGYDRAVPIWNASLSKFLLKRRLQIGIAVSDLLNRNTGISRTADLNYVQDQRTASLGRFAMLRCTYSLNSAGNDGPGGMRMMIRR